MNKDLGTYFSEIRRSKNIPIKHIVGETISESQYYRFVNGDSEISFSKFLFLLDQINITLEEFSYTALNYTDPLKKGMLSIKEYFEKQDINSLIKLREYFTLQGQETKKLKYIHLSYICSVLISKLDLNKGHTAKEEKDLLIKYLMCVENWGHYELVLFNNTFFLFDINCIQILFKNAVKLSAKYKSIYNNTFELTKLYSNLIVFFLENREIKFAITIIDSLSLLKIDSESIYEKLLITYWKTIKEYYINNQQTSLQSITQLFNFLELIECFEIKHMLETILNYVIKLELTK